MTIFLADHPVRQQRTLEEFETPFRSYLRAKFDDAWDSNFTPMAAETLERKFPVLNPLEPDYRAPQQLNATDARAKAETAGVKGLQISDDGMAESSLDVLIARRKRQMANEDAISRSPAGFRSVAGFGAALAAGLLDPLNVAAGFVPIVGQARYALALAKAAGGLERAGIRAAVGGIQGAAGTAILEPFSYAMHQGLQDDYHMLDSLMNIGFGATIGGILHAGGGAISDRLTGRYAREAVAANGGTVGASTAAAVAERAASAPFELKATGRTAADILTDVEADTARRIKIEETPGFLRTQEERIAASRPYQLAENVTPELERAIEIAQKPGFQRTADENIFLKAMRGGQEVQFLNERLSRALGAGDTAEAAAIMARFAEIGQSPADAKLLLERLDQNTRDAAMRTAITQALQGKYPDLAAVIQNDPKSGMRADDPGAALRATAERQSRPEAVRVADPRAAADAERQVSEAPKTHDIADAEKSLADAEQQFNERARVAGMTPEAMKAEMAMLDEFMAQANDYAKAAEAAAICGLR